MLSGHIFLWRVRTFTSDSSSPFLFFLRPVKLGGVIDEGSLRVDRVFYGTLTSSTCDTPYRIVPYHTHCTTLFHTIPYYTIPYCTIPYMAVCEWTNSSLEVKLAGLVPHHTTPYQLWNLNQQQPASSCCSEACFSRLSHTFPFLQFFVSIAGIF